MFTRLFSHKQLTKTMMNKFFKVSAILLAGVLCCQTISADIFNFGGVRTTIYSFSNKSFEGAEQEVRPMGTITAINNNGPLNVMYVEGDKNEVVVRGDKDLFNRVQTQWKDGAVNISLEPGTYRNVWLQVVVYAKSINSIRNTGSGNFKAEKITSEAPELGLKVTGSGTISIGEVNCSRDVDLHISGSGDIAVKEIDCKDLDLDVTGSGDIKVTDVKFVDMDADVRGSGGIKLSNVDGKTADVNIAGSGNIKFESGSINFIKARIAGSGCIIGNVNHKSLEQKTAGSGYIKFNNSPDQQ